MKGGGDGGAMLDDVPRSERDRAFVAFVLDTQTRLHRVAYLVCGDLHQAEDALQTALTRVYRHWNRLDTREDPWSYARRAVINAAIDERRRPWRREASTEHFADVAVPDRTSLDDAVLAALSDLPRDQRAVVVLRYIEDLDIHQVAVLLDMPPNTVKSHAARGLNVLRARLSAGAVARNASNPTRIREPK
jgi:RNA polymerase sigma-70 factor (sigma-E family)